MPSDIREIQRHAAILLTQVFMAFGHPHDLLRRGFIHRHLHSQINEWVRHLEHVVRRIIFVLALAIAAPPPGPHLATKPKATQPRRFTSPQRPFVLARTPSRVSRRVIDDPFIARLIDMLRTGPRSVVVRSRSLARRIEALRHALRHADERAQSVARAIARRLVDPVRATPKITLQRWRASYGVNTVASMFVADYIVAFERLMPPHFTDDS